MSVRAAFVLAVALASAINVANASKMTRYWDCCKPSSAWGGKADLVSPLQICQKDGVTPIEGSARDQGKSVCDGGDQHICNNLQPYTDAINPNLGFAYVAFPSNDEASTSCSCYHIKVQSSAELTDLIVQAVNTGGDVNEGNIDVQIPGGGVGQFAQGCQNQWGAGENWGKAYGGVNSKSECSNLPDKLQKGCMWRFTKWADNPLIVGKPQRVRCVQSLINKSGCQRADEMQQTPYSGEVSPENQAITATYKWTGERNTVGSAETKSTVSPSTTDEPSTPKGATGSTGSGSNDSNGLNGSNGSTDSKDSDSGKGTGAYPTPPTTLKHNDHHGHKGKHKFGEHKVASEQCDSGANPDKKDSTKLERRDRGGWMTAYHDCCIQSGSWENKAAVYSPVKVCNAAGKQILYKGDMRSACGGAPSASSAFVCPDMEVPFWDNDTLFGFTAISTLHDEKATECACYETTLTSRQLAEDKGKWTKRSIIYQVTSIGGLDKMNDIDLLTGTAGMGANMQGCPAQYPHAKWLDPSNFGGKKVQSSAQCAQLVQNNKCMRAGCEIIAGLPNNPWVGTNAKRVACPARLLALSQCQRKDEYLQRPSSLVLRDACNKPPQGYNQANFKFDYKNSKCQGAFTRAAQQGQCADI